MRRPSAIGHARRGAARARASAARRGWAIPTEVVELACVASDEQALRIVAPVRIPLDVRRTARVASALPQDQVVRDAALDRLTVGIVARGGNKPVHRDAVKLARALGTTRSALLDGIG